MDLDVGDRLRSAVCHTEVIVVRAPRWPIELRCGGVPMRSLTDEAPPGQIVGGHDGGTAMGKRYVGEGGVEVLCTKPGDGALSTEEDRLTVKDAKRLPSAD